MWGTGAPDGEGPLGGTRGRTRLTQREAAEALGVSVEAIRKRVKRGTPASEKGEDGRRCVDVARDRPPDAEAKAWAEGWELLDELRGRVRFLEDQLRQEREARERADHIVAGLIQRIPELEAPASITELPPELGESPTEATEQPGRGVGAQPSVEGAQEGTERVSWWQRIFGG